MRSFSSIAALSATTALAACSIWTVPLNDPGLTADYKINRSTPAAILGVAPNRMFEGTQNWTDDIRTAFWHVPQGSLATPYDLAINIEQANSEKRFLDHQNVARYRYVPQNKKPLDPDNSELGNPDGLPLGFTKSNTVFDGQSHLGMTCAACHSTVMTYKGSALLIDGAPTQADFQSFWADYTKAFRATLDDEAKFDRLAERLTQGTLAEREALRKRLQAATEKMEAREHLNRTSSRYGYGRVDAVGQIYNSVTVQNLGIPGNYRDPDAPVSFPFLWGTHQSDLVQWNGFAPNAPKDPDLRIAGPMVRNFGEVLGVFGELQLQPDNRRRDVTYKNSVRIQNLLNIEEWLERLGPPAWPADIFGELDPDLVARGAEVYSNPRLGNCAGCHTIQTDTFACYNSVMVPIKALGTDPKQAENSLRSAQTGFLEGRYKNLAITDGKPVLGSKELVIDILKHQIIRSGLHDVEDSKIRSLATLYKALKQERREETCAVKPQDPPKEAKDFMRYKSRPLNGIWATAPFLHNGSVPTLRALLDAPEDRPKTFTLGGWEYDPVAVGYAPYDGPNPFTFDVTLPGNSNGGHVWGADLSPADKDALVEYLKSL